MGHVGLLVAGAAIGVHPPRHGGSDQLLPSVDGGYPDSVPCRRRALAVSGGERGAVVSGDVEEGVEVEVSDASPRVAAWTRVAARMRWVVPELWRRNTSWSPRSWRCCCIAAGLCRASGSAGAAACGAGCGEGGGVGGAGVVFAVPCGVGDGVYLAGRGRGDSQWCVSAGAGGGRDRWASLRGASVAWSRGGGGIMWGWDCWWRGGRGWVLCWTGVRASRRVVCVLRVRVVRFLRSLAGRSVEMGGGCLGIRVELWSVGSGRLLVDGACWHGLRLGELLIAVGCSL